MNPNCRHANNYVQPPPIAPWTNTFSFEPRAVEAPESLEQLQTIMASAEPPIRVAGSGLAFSPLISAQGGTTILLSHSAFASVNAIHVFPHCLEQESGDSTVDAAGNAWDTACGEIDVGAGMQIREVQAYLREWGLMLHGFPDEQGTPLIFLCNDFCQVL